MNMHCSMCRAFVAGHSSAPARVWDTVLAETRSFVVCPTVGSVVEGWLLVLPREHTLCLGALSQEKLEELADLKSAVAAVLKAAYGPVAVFEHGPCLPSQAVGCGVDHAHLHMVPTAHDLEVGAGSVSPIPLSWKRVSGIEAARDYYMRGLPYLYLEQPIGTARMATHPELPSQLFRRVLAAYAGKPGRWDWRSFAYAGKVARTVRTLGESLRTFNLPGWSQGVLTG